MQWVKWCSFVNWKNSSGVHLNEWIADNLFCTWRTHCLNGLFCSTFRRDSCASECLETKSPRFFLLCTIKAIIRLRMFFCALIAMGHLNQQQIKIVAAARILAYSLVRKMCMLVNWLSGSIAKFCASTTHTYTWHSLYGTQVIIHDRTKFMR